MSVTSLQVLPIVRQLSECRRKDQGHASACHGARLRFTGTDDETSRETLLP